ncbi:baseplate multidomain protein megatron [Roseibium aestuarii]|uniref:Glycoside hydrolase TIM-barrel-like domain-containing protein n=1 Tax=Roseibium aestuarii TaxID=2600299 RepID=A0ABW4JVN8_9HYPH|nr:glycoside hydrolase/phage tail family protein [Roseibium aestuarii]
MATLLLTAAGQALGAGLGGLFGLGGIGGVIGKAAGALVGAGLDGQLFGSSGTVEGSRLEDLSVQASTEGASLPRLYGRMRLAGQVIWATSFEEEVSEERQGGKGGGSRVTVRSYAYYGNFAVALCEGPITRIGRVWADGKLLDTSTLTWRIHRGEATQAHDPLIAAVQGETPAYRGTAYVVFERLPLEPFGNRLPQLTFEVIRVVEPLEGAIRAVTLIPGAGEFVYQPTRVTASPAPGVTESVNRHVPSALSDWQASLDELQELCPGLERVALVVAWFGDDLRAGHCTLRPKVETPEKSTNGATWSVSGLSRGQAEVVSRIADAPAFGGTPSDGSVIAAIRDLKARGLKVTLYPFILMDIPPDNGLADPHGGTEQAAFPWRGRLVAASDPDAEVASFFGAAARSDLQVNGDSVALTGASSADWGYRRFILHLAGLAQAAGGVDAFLIGSEMRGLTRSRAASGTYPFVQGLVSLAADVRAVLGSGTSLSYAADWSEYGAHVPAAGELRFPLDPLWSSPEIDFVGIDCYVPLTDQRDGDDPDGGGPDGGGRYDLEDLRAGVTGGEDHDWYYASPEDRIAGTRSPITDGAYGKPFVYRAKDFAGWWSNPHVERSGGVELTTPTGWVPGSKPIWFTELGCPAIDRGANQPNVFVDAKSAESAVPHFSRGTRDDLIQRRALEASLGAWGAQIPGVEPVDQPVSPLDGTPMIDPAHIHLWTWDARPFPAFPLYGDVWSDDGNWRFGHWLNGRLGTVSVAGVLRAMLLEDGLDPDDFQVEGLSGQIEGLVIGGQTTTRQAIEPLLEAFDGIAVDTGTQVRFLPRDAASRVPLTEDDVVETEDGAALLTRTRLQASEMPLEVRFSAASALGDYQRRVVASRRLDPRLARSESAVARGASRISELSLSASVAPDLLQQAAETRLARIWSARERVELSLSPLRLDVEPGDLLVLEALAGETFSPALDVSVGSLEDTDARRIEGHRVGGTRAVPRALDVGSGPVYPGGELGRAEALLLDLPPMRDSDPEAPLRLAAFARPWGGGMTLMRSAEQTGFQPLLEIERPSVMGRLATPLPTGPVAYLDRHARPEVTLFGAVLESRSLEAVLSGLNALAVAKPSGGFEVLQFLGAELTGERTYRLSGLLRGQAGTEPEAGEIGLIGAAVVLLDPDRVPLVPLSADQLGLTLAYRLVPGGRSLEDDSVTALTHAATGRGLRPRAPVHLRAQRGPGGIQISWIRQTRRGGDGWDQTEVPLAETTEAYEVDILSASGTVVRTLQVSAAEALYATADELADFGGPLTVLRLQVMQLSATVGRGFPGKADLNV